MPTRSASRERAHRGSQLGVHPARFVLYVVGAFGLVRMPEVFTRMHAASVTDTLGVGFLILGMGLQAGLSLVTLKLLFLLALFFFTGPVVTHALAQACLHEGIRPMLTEDRRRRGDPQPEQATGGSHRSRHQCGAPDAARRRDRRRRAPAQPVRRRRPDDHLQFSDGERLDRARCRRCRHDGSFGRGGYLHGDPACDAAPDQDDRNALGPDRTCCRCSSRSGTGAILVWGTLALPPFGTADAVIHKHVVPRYLADSIKETNVPNVVTSVLADYRGYDTLGETTVIFTAGIGVMLLLRGSRRRGRTKERGRNTVSLDLSFASAPSSSCRSSCCSPCMCSSTATMGRAEAFRPASSRPEW